ncbi:MAG: RagB/SusD family nutrient uptake outer membrane protein [Mucilaginibacter sp.]|nr:RagB/SusD family nutrient uptake outer membrane protein [Mucilaginibacter sp.]
MKRTLLILFISITALSACKKVLDTVPTGTLTPVQAYTSNAQIQAALSGIYVNIKGGISYGQFYSAYMTIGTDETYFYNTNFGYTQYNNVATDPQLTAFWKGCYASINYANTLLDNIDVSSAGKVDSATVRKAKGEALFLRGYYYFMLAQWFGDVPMQLHATSDPTQGQIARTPVKRVYDQIITDMTAADGMLYDQTFASLGYSERVTRTAVEGMLARVCLYAAGQPVNDTKRYADALTWSTKVIQSGQHSLLSDYRQPFIDEAKNAYNRENIWEVGYSQKAPGTVGAGGGVGVYVGVTMTSSNGSTSAGGAAYDTGYVYGYAKLHPRLYAAYEPGDYRRDWNCSNYTYSGTVKAPLTAGMLWSRSPAKWRREYEPAVSRSTQMASGENFPLLRYADVLLMQAEAENEVNGPSALAFAAVNQVRRRAIAATKIVDSIGYTPGTGYTSIPTLTYTTGGGTGLAISLYTSYNSSTKIYTVSPLLTVQGSGFTSAPVISIGNQWTAATSYAIGTQVTSGRRLYTVTTAGTSTGTAPTNTSGASSASSTGAVFTYAGAAANATAYLTTPIVPDLAPNLTKEQFRKAIQDERSRELCFEALRQQDLKRWGILISTIQSLVLDINGVNAAYPGIKPLANEIPANVVLALAPTQNISTKDIFWPIPSYDLMLNKLLTQNPGY